LRRPRRHVPRRADVASRTRTGRAGVRFARHTASRGRRRRARAATHARHDLGDSVTNEAAKPNAALQPLSVLIGTWNTVGTHPLVPGTTFHGRTSFEWIEGGAFLIMHSQIDEPDIPSGIAVFGTDDTTGECSMLYFDERGVSRKYEVSVQENVWKWW